MAAPPANEFCEFGDTYYPSAVCTASGSCRTPASRTVRVSVYRRKDLKAVTPGLDTGGGALTTHFPVGAVQPGKWNHILIAGTRDADGHILSSDTYGTGVLVNRPNIIPQVVPLFDAWGEVPGGGTTFDPVALASTSSRDVAYLYSMGGADRAFYSFQWRLNQSGQEVWTPLGKVPGGQRGATGALAIGQCRTGKTVCLFDEDADTMGIVWNVYYQKSVDPPMGTWVGWQPIAGFTNVPLAGLVAHGRYGGVVIFSRDIATRKIIYNVLDPREIPRPATTTTSSTTTTTSTTLGCSTSTFGTSMLKYQDGFYYLPNFGSGINGSLVSVTNAESAFSGNRLFLLGSGYSGDDCGSPDAGYFLGPGESADAASLGLGPLPVTLAGCWYSTGEVFNPPDYIAVAVRYTHCP